LQEKTPELHHTSVPVALKLNKKKKKILTINVGNDEPVTLEGEKLEKVAYMLKTVWKSRVIGTSTKVHLLNANGKPTLVYMRETPHG